MIIDAHHHYERSEGYIDRLLHAADKCSIDKICLFGGGAGYEDDYADNDMVLAAAKLHPDRIIPFAYIQLGVDDSSQIDKFFNQGFKGIKFINPKKNYDDKDYYEIYSKMQNYKLPGIFHLGIVARSPNDNKLDIHNDRHRPVYLDTIARAFPSLNLIGAHFGNPWYEEAAMVARWNPNLYFDLTGSTLKCKSPEFLADLLWWTPTSRYKDPQGRFAWEKIVFGSDVPCDEIYDVYRDYRFVMSQLGVSDNVQLKVLGGTMAELLNLTK